MLHAEFVSIPLLEECVDNVLISMSVACLTASLLGASGAANLAKAT